MDRLLDFVVAFETSWEKLVAAFVVASSVAGSSVACSSVDPACSSIALVKPLASSVAVASSIALVEPVDSLVAVASSVEPVGSSVLGSSVEGSSSVASVKPLASWADPPYQ